MVKKGGKKGQYLAGLAKNLRAARKNKGLSQEKAAWLSGISYKFYQDVERGKKDITTHNLWKLSRALDITADKLIPSLDEDYLDLPE
ncbi:MAG: helix-turn-helix transcriptional regulator [Nitrospirota bacterium]